MSRRTKSILPITDKLLQPKIADPSIIKNRTLHSKSLQKKYYDQTAKQLPPLEVNDQVRVQFGKIWKPAKVIKKHDARSCSVQTSNGAIYRRNRRLLGKTNNDPSKTGSFHPDIFAQPVISNTPAELPSTSSSSIINESDRNLSIPNAPYITRSGREVKPNRRYDDDSWVKYK